MTLTGTKDTTCYVCGVDNALGLQVPFERDGTTGSRATYVARKEHSGWSGILHGGVTLSLMDEAFGWCLFFQGVAAVTARIETRFHRPIPIGTRLWVRAWLVGERRKLFDVKAEVRGGDADGRLFAESEAVLCRVATSGAPRDQTIVRAAV